MKRPSDREYDAIRDAERDWLEEAADEAEAEASTRAVQCDCDEDWQEHDDQADHEEGVEDLPYAERDWLDLLDDDPSWEMGSHYEDDDEEVGS